MIKSIQLKNWQAHENLKLDFSENLNIITGLSDTGKCLTGETLIPNPINGQLYSINDLLTNPEHWQVWSLNEKNNKIEPKNIVAITANGTKRVFDLLLKSGKYIKSTDNHRFLSDAGWKELSQFKKNDFIATPRYIPPHISQIDIPIETARLIGYFLGDGGISRNNEPSFINADKLIIKDFFKCLRTIGNHHIKRRKNSKATTFIFSKPICTINRHLGKSDICKLLEKFEILGTVSKTKFIPGQFFSSSDKIIGNILGALFDCDGYIPQSNRNLEYCSSSKTLIYQYQHLLLKLGIQSKIIKTYKKCQEKKFPTYILFISSYNNIKLFAEKVILKGKKKELLQKRINQTINLNYSKHNVFPQFVRILINNYLKRNTKTAKKLRQQIKIGISRAYLNMKQQTISRLFAEKICTYFNIKKLSKHVFNDIYWDRVKEIIYVSELPTYDLEIEDNHNFIANNIFVHNSCIRRAFDWVIFNANISESDYRKEGSDLTSVSICLYNGFEIERVRSNSINRYIIKKENCEDKIFDNTGREIPQEIKDIFNISEIEIDKDYLNLNISNQLSLPFLLDKSGSFRAKLFNKLTGNELLDQLFQDCNKENLNINKEIKRLDEQIIEQEKDVKKCTEEYNLLYQKLQQIKEIYNKIEDKILIYEELKKLAEKIKNNKETSDVVKNKLKKVVIISEDTISKLKEKVEYFKVLSDIKNKLNEVNLNLDKIAKEQKHFNIPETNLNDLNQKIDMYTDLKQLYYNLEQKKKSFEEISILLKDKKIELDNLSTNLKEIWKSLDFCEKCKPKAEQIIFGKSK